MSKEIDDIVRSQVERGLKKYYQMNKLEKAQYRRKLMHDIEAGKHASAEIHTEKLIKRLTENND